MFPGVWRFTLDARLLRVGILMGEVTVKRLGLQEHRSLRLELHLR